MRVLVVGLGLIGGSIAEGLSKKGYEVYGVDKNIDALLHAYKQGFIKEYKTEPDEFFPKVNWIILALYPSLIGPFISEYQPFFTANHRITDVCGIKSFLANEYALKALPAKYLSCHPMAGREKGGYTYANSDIFQNANFLITPFYEIEEEIINELKQMAKDLNFGNITIVTPAFHDRLIAYTSQLPHALAVALVNANQFGDNASNYTGDSYRDLTRIAMINEVLWDELFFSNKEILTEEIDKFIAELKLIKSSLQNDDHDMLKALFIKAKNKRGGFK